MNNIVDISTYHPSKSDKFFFDANIWMYLYCPLGDYKRETIKEYDGFLKKAIQSKSSIFISSLVLSEFFNSWVRLDFNILNKSNPLKFKTDYRNTKLYESQVLTIRTVVIRQIMQIAKRIDDKFANISLDELFEEIENSDFNDNYFLTMANLEGLKIVTNDLDFASPKKTSITILTANKKMLNRV